MMRDRLYQVGGSLAYDAASYVVRKADVELDRALQRGEFCYVLDSRQMGKSSLLVRTLHQLEARGCVCVSIDLTYLGSEFRSPLQWYKGLVAQLWTGFGLTNIDFKSWWQEREFSYLQRLGEFIKLLLARFPQQKIYIFVDEIDRIKGLDFPVDDFFALIRYCYNQRAINSDYQRIAFALFGVATPRDLIENKKLTPFNIGLAIALEGFKLTEVEPLIVGLSCIAYPQAILGEILAWTGGQPFLTQKLCQLIVGIVPAMQLHPFRHKQSKSVREDGAYTPSSPKDVGLSESFREKSLVKEDFVTDIVVKYIIDNWQSQDEPEHLRTIRDRLLYNPRNAGRLLGIYQQILQFGSVQSDDSCEQVELLLSGLVIKEDNYLQVKNRIYREV